tara:strand:+ start:5798 stop:5986 length:189 start_codon:yes stop_codon:yes gene_type:complete
MVRCDTLETDHIEVMTAFLLLVRVCIAAFIVLHLTGAEFISISLTRATQALYDGGGRREVKV